jgi:cytochrome c556
MPIRTFNRAAVVVGALSLLGAAVGGAALAETAAAKAVAARQAGYKQLGGAFKTINDELKKDAPDMAAIAAAATKMRDASAAIPGWFPKGSGAEAGVETRAKPEIWSDPAGFAAANGALKAEVAKLQKLAVAGDLAGVRGQVKPTGASCSGCHDKYRTPKS